VKRRKDPTGLRSIRCTAGLLKLRAVSFSQTDRSGAFLSSLSRETLGRTAEKTFPGCGSMANGLIGVEAGLCCEQSDAAHLLKRKAYLCRTEHRPRRCVRAAPPGPSDQFARRRASGLKQTDRLSEKDRLKTKWSTTDRGEASSRV